MVSAVGSQACSAGSRMLSAIPPFDPPVRAHGVRSAAAPVYLSGVPSEHYLWGVPLTRGTLSIRAWTAPASIYRSRLQPSQCSSQNLLCVKYVIDSFKGILDAQILDRCCFYRLETASRSCLAGKEVRQT
jgi:hypothetical protein